MVYKEDDFGYTFTINDNEILKYEFKSLYLPKMINTVKNNSVNFSKDSIFYQNSQIKKINNYFLILI